MISDVLTSTHLLRVKCMQGKLSRFYTLHGHRDAGATRCPGDALYNEIRTWPRYRGRL